MELDSKYEDDPHQYKTTGVACRLGDLMGLQQMVWNGVYTAYLLLSQYLDLQKFARQHGIGLHVEEDRYGMLLSGYEFRLEFGHPGPWHETY